MTGRPRSGLTVSEYRNRMPGFTVCGRCLQITDNVDLREVVRPGRIRGRKVCQTCSAELTGG